MLKNQSRLIPFALFGFAGLCFARIIPTYFLSDDFGLIGRVARQGMFFVWGNSQGGFLRPFTTLSFVADHQLWGLNPIGYHLTNIFFHAAAAFALFHIALHFFHKHRSVEPVLASFLTACLFIALPSHSESVSWISGRTDVIAAALGLTATACFLFLLDKRSLLQMILAPPLLAAALLAKESAIVFPVIWIALFLHDRRLKKRRPCHYSVVVLALSWFLLAAYFLLRKAAIGSFVGGYGTAEHLSFIQISTVSNAFRYLFRTFIPALPHPWLDLSQPLSLLACGLATAALALLSIACWRQLRKSGWSLAWVMILCYSISLIPVITLRIAIFDTQGERFLYLPSAFACLLLVHLVSASIAHVRFRWAALFIVVALQASALQWINSRWVTASQLSQQIAREVSKADPAKTIVLNLPDNFQGAYVFRHGLDEAATLFMGNERRVAYRWICGHGVNSMDQLFEAGSEGGAITLTLPSGVRFHTIQELGFQVQKRGRTLMIADPSGAHPESLSLLSFSSGARTPMLRTVGSRLR